MLAIDFDVINTVEGSEPEVVAHYSHGFPLATKSDEVHEYLKNYLANFTANAARAELNKERDAALAQADETIAAVVGAEITN